MRVGIVIVTASCFLFRVRISHQYVSGSPSLDFFKAMRAEHTTRGGSDFDFVTGNYNVKTQARKEWLYVCPYIIRNVFAFISSDLGTSWATRTGKLFILRLPT